MKAFYALGFVVVAYLALANCAPFLDDEIQKLIEKFRVDCTKKFDCPSGSASCSKNVTTTPDRATIITEIKCFSSDGQLLNNGDGITTETNKNPNGIRSSYEYYGSFSGGSNTVHTTNYGSSNPINTDIETFQK